MEDTHKYASDMRKYTLPSKGSIICYGVGKFINLSKKQKVHLNIDRGLANIWL